MIRETSLEAYEKLRTSGQLSEKRWEAYQIVYREGPMTARQVYERVPGGKYKSHTAGRLSEMVHMGVLREVGTAPCPITGNRVIFYDVTSAVTAKNVPRTHTKTERIKFLESRVLELEEEIAKLRSDNELRQGNVRASGENPHRDREVAAPLGLGPMQLRLDI